MLFEKETPKSYSKGLRGAFLCRLEVYRTAIIQDELDSAKKELKSIRLQNDELARKVREYKITCESQEAEIALLKEKLG